MVAALISALAWDFCLASDFSWLTDPVLTASFTFASIPALDSDFTSNFTSAFAYYWTAETVFYADFASALEVDAVFCSVA